MKVYPLLFSRKFPKGHPRCGEQTMFVSNIKGGGKIHTVRSNYAFWAPKIAEVADGKAILSLRYWTGTPYASEQQEFLQLTADFGVGIERVHDYAGHGQVSSPKDPNFRNLVYLDDLADNDGLEEDDFRAWFPSWGLGDERAIIHFTKFRYAEVVAEMAVK